MNNLSICVQAKHFPAVGKALPKCAIADLSMSVQAGEFVCLIGPSGCGKTTLLNIISGAIVLREHGAHRGLDRQESYGQAPVESGPSVVPELSGPVETGAI